MSKPTMGDELFALGEKLLCDLTATCGSCRCATPVIPSGVLREDVKHEGLVALNKPCPFAPLLADVDDPRVCPKFKRATP